eukprot:1188169-Prorocentrum_minimum.AAC.1
MLYLAEMFLRVWANGWHDYWHMNQNRFDFAITWLVLAIQFFVFAPGMFSWAHHDVIRYVQLIRIVRLVRLFEYIPQYRVIVHTASVVLPSLFHLMRLLTLLFFAFATLGVMLFGGLLSPESHAPLLRFRAPRSHALRWPGACKTVFLLTPTTPGEGPRPQPHTRRPGVLFQPLRGVQLQRLHLRLSATLQLAAAERLAGVYGGVREALRHAGN